MKRPRLLALGGAVRCERRRPAWTRWLGLGLACAALATFWLAVAGAFG